LSEHGYAGRLPTDPPHSLEMSLSGVRIMQEPGSGYRYSGGGYTVLQLVIEEVTGEPFAAYMQREVLDPLGMTRSSFDWRADLRPATAIGHDPQGQPHPNYLFTETAAAGLYTTASDLARFAAAAMTGPQGQPAGRAVLPPGTVAQMLTPVVFADEAVAAGVTKSPHQTTTGLGYGMGAAPDGTVLVGHGGKNQGWEALFETQPDRREGIVILTNSDHGFAFAQPVMDAWYSWLGVGPADAPRSPQPNHSTRNTVVLAIAGLVLLTAILWGGYLLRVRRAKRESDPEADLAQIGSV
jgi:CubicO group peptidase (beta-lactamase class C family)